MDKNTEVAMYEYIGQLEEKIRVLKLANEQYSRANLNYKHHLEKLGVDVEKLHDDTRD